MLSFLGFGGAGATEEAAEAPEAEASASGSGGGTSGRARKRPRKYGDAGELEDGFRSAPLAPKPATDPASEMGVPAFARPGEAVYATGLRAGVRMRFRAEVTALRVQFPRIVVRYTASEDGTATHPHALPEMRTAYVTMADVAPRDW